MRSPTEEFQYFHVNIQIFKFKSETKKTWMSFQEVKAPAVLKQNSSVGSVSVIVAESSLLTLTLSPPLFPGVCAAAKGET